MGGCCCCCASKSTELNSPPFLHYPVSEEHQPLSPHNATVSALSTGLLVDTNLDTSVPDTYRPPPAPIPYDTYVENQPPPSIEETNASSTLETKLKNLESDEKTEINTEPEESKEVEDENPDELKKSSEPYVPPPRDECPICLEDYDEENPKITTKCDHHFHLACILEWMERSDTCSVCDQEMVFDPTIGV